MRQLDVEREKAEGLRREIAMGLEQAKRGDFSELSVMEIAARVLQEPDQ